MNYKELHDRERPVAMLSSITANSQRDKKKVQKPYTYLDFSFYKPVSLDDAPQGSYGSAYAELVKTKRLPAWALFCFKSLMGSANPGYIPEEPAYIAEDAILLHPEAIGGGGYKGLLIAMESAGDQRRLFVDSMGRELVLTVPYVETKFVANEGATLLP